MLGSCWPKLGFRRLLGADPQLIVGPRSQNGILFGSIQAWERGRLEAKNGRQQLGIRICRPSREKLARVELLVP